MWHLLKYVKSQGLILFPAERKAIFNKYGLLGKKNS